jgi:hypothetical protein
MRILDRFKATFEHKSDKPHEQTESKNPKWKQEKGTMKDEHRESDNFYKKVLQKTHKSNLLCTRLMGCGKAAAVPACLSVKRQATEQRIRMRDTK